MISSSYSISFHKRSSSQFNLEKQITSSFLKAYYINDEYYNSRIINDIIYNEKAHIVSLFKDNLILDECAEFLKRFYTTEESLIRLPRFFEYHETYSKIYPNYTALPESKYIYKNIHKKQKIIDQQQNLEISIENRNKKRKLNKESKYTYEKQVFSTDVCNSLANDSSLMRSLFGLSKKNFNLNNNINEKHIEYDNDNNISIYEIEKIITIIDKYQRELYMNHIKYKKNISNSNNISSTRGKHVISLSNQHINEQNTNTIIHYNKQTYRMAQNKIVSRLPSKNTTTLSKEMYKKSNVNELQLPKSSCITGNNSLVKHRKTISAHNINNSTKEKIKVKTNSNGNCSSAKATFEAERIKNRIKRSSQHHNNKHNNSALSNSSTLNNNSSKITYRNRIIPTKNNTLGVRTTYNTLNSYNKTNGTNQTISTIKSTTNASSIKNKNIYTSSNIIKRLIPQSSKNRHSSTNSNRNGAQTERILNYHKQEQNDFEIALLNHFISKTKSNSQSKMNDYQPLSSRASSTIGTGSRNKGKKKGNNDNHNTNKETMNSIIPKQIEKKISVNVMNKNNLSCKINNSSQKNITNPILNNEQQHSISKQSQHSIIQSQTQKNIIKGIQIKDFGKAIELSDINKISDNYNSDSSRKKVINVNIKHNNTKYLPHTTRPLDKNVE